MLIKEHRFTFQIGAEEHVLRVQELVWGPERWPEQCRIHLEASHTREARHFYGGTPLETARKAAEYLTSYSSIPAISATSRKHSVD